MSMISPSCKRRLHVQGYQNYDDQELESYRFGFRFAYYVCATLVGLGLLLNNLPILIIAASIALLGTIPPYHPVDYLYNYAIRKIIHKPKIPPRTNQGRFACGIATVWLSVTIYFFYKGYLVTGYIMGGIIFILATLVSSTDICIPSIIYNAIFRRKTDTDKI